MSEKIVTAALVIIGNEVLSGRTRDANLQFLALGLNEIGIRLKEVRVVPDEEAEIIAAVDECRRKHDHVFTTGGIGPTHDDITSAAIAKAMGRRHVRDPRAEAMLRQHYKPEDINPARLRMADVPEGAILIDNPVSKAPGFQVENVYVLPGVPRILQAMFDGLKHRLKGGAPMLSRSIAAYLQEGNMAAGLTALQARHADLEIGSYPFVRDGKLGSSIVIRGTDRVRVDAAAEELKAMMRSLGGAPMEDDAPPAAG